MSERCLGCSKSTAYTCRAELFELAHQWCQPLKANKNVKAISNCCPGKKTMVERSCQASTHIIDRQWPETGQIKSINNHGFTTNFAFFICVIRMYKNGRVEPIIYQCFNAKNSWHLKTSRKSQNPAIKCRSALFLHFGFFVQMKQTRSCYLLSWKELKAANSPPPFPPWRIS